MPKYRNPNAWRLTWRSIGGWRCVTLFDVNESLESFRGDIKLPDTFIGKVRLFLELSKADELMVRQNRYFDTVEYQIEEKLKGSAAVRINTGSCV